jgi:L-asparaginase/Glu-tRNA(Gln) amidotransferase subunit D
MSLKEVDHAPSWLKQPTFLRFKEAYKNSDRPLFFIGSGISLWAGLPNWKTLLLGLARDASEALREESIYEETKSLISSNNFQRAGSRLKAAFASIGEDQWRAALTRILNDSQLQKQESRIHDAIVDLNWHRIITTNYDGLIEAAIHRSQSGKHREAQICHPKKKNLEEIESSGKPFIFKIHGDIMDDSSPIILAEEEYLELYGKEDPLYFQRTLGTVLRTSSVILFVGYSHNDTYVRTLFKHQMERTITDKVFAVVPREGKLEDFENKIKELTDELQIRFITYSPDNHHQELLELFEYLSDENTEKYDARYNVLSTIKKPTVVMVYCGGTIGSTPHDDEGHDNLPLEVVIKESRYDKELTEFSEKLIRWYGQSYNAGHSLQLDIKWEVLPKEQQVFSENATPELWNKIREKVELLIFKYFHAPSILSTTDSPFSNNDIRPLFEYEYNQYKEVFPSEDLSEAQFTADFSNKYILGIVLLFGTDTLAYTAPALSLGLQHLPCPIIITGANQPPQEKNLLSRSQFYVTSDAWRNLMTSLYFLQCFGHRLRETFVCFGDTVHHSVNLRKRAIEIIPFNKGASSTRYDEPFTFRNLSFYSQYMFKLIDGVFCNNYYSSNYINYSTLAGGPESSEFRDLRHIRFDALQNEPPRKTVGNYFSSSVRYVEVTPSFPLIDVQRMVETKGSGHPLQVVLVEGYASGTYPTGHENSFSKFLSDLYQHGIPVILVSRYGILPSQQEYKTQMILGEDIPVLRLYDLVTETALPLLSLVIGSIPAAMWEMEDMDVCQRVGPRLQLIKKIIDKFFRSRPNIISEEFKDITDRDKRYYRLRMETARLNEDAQYEIPAPNIFYLPGWGESNKESNSNDESNKESNSNDHVRNFVTIPRQEFISITEEIVKPFKRVGAGPDGLAVLNNIGFKQGLLLVQTFSTKMSKAAGFETYFERVKTDRDVLLNTANVLLADVRKWVRTAGIADVEIKEKVKVYPVDDSENKDITMPPRNFSFTIKVPRRERSSTGDEKYAALTYSHDEAAFFTKLGQGYADKSEMRELNSHYKRLLRDTWQHRTQALDWLVLGVFKGVAYGLAQLFRFDQWANKSIQTKTPGPQRVLREAIKCNVLLGDENYFSFKFTYFESPDPVE